MSINNEKVRMHRLPIYRVALVRETSQPSILNCIKTPRNVYEIGATYLEGADLEQDKYPILMFLIVKSRICKNQ